MTTRAQGLARMLSDLGTRHAIRIPQLSRDLRLAVGRVRVTAADRCEIYVDRHLRFQGEIGRELREAIGAQPDALWVFEAQAETVDGVATPFAPPHQARLDGVLPVLVPEGMDDKLSQVRVALGEDLARVGSLSIAQDTVAVVGLRTFAALDDEDAERMTWWLPSGDGLELRLLTDSRGAWLHLVDVVRQRDRRAAHAGPTALIELGEDARLVVEPSTSSSRGSLTVAAALRPARSDLMDAWVRYGAAAREQQAERQAKRQEHPLTFQKAHQQGKVWTAEVPLSPEATEAWLGAGTREGRKVRVSQPVALEGLPDDRKRFTLDTLTLRGPGLARATLSSQRGTSRLPESGRFELREDIGSLIKEARERAAIETLSSGRAACPRLPLLLRRPGKATPPRLRPLQRSPSESLDNDQRRAVQLILGCEDLIAIQGPPGTGKTRVIVEALRQITARTGPGGHPVRVLVSSVQNEAVGNVAERLAQSEGALVKVVQRGAKDEDEIWEFAARADAERDACIERLRRSLEGFEFQARLDHLEELRRHVESARTALASGRAETSATRLAQVVSEGEGDLSLLILQELATLSDALLAWSGHPSPPSQAASGPPVVPTEPAAVAAWWEAARVSLPAASVAAVGFQVQQVLDALALPEGSRRDRRLNRAWTELGPSLADLSQAGASHPPPLAHDESGEQAFAMADALCRQALVELRKAEAEVNRHPKAIALRFLRALETDPGSWKRIVDNHGGTVAATCSMSAKAARPPGEHYDWVIIDEAGRASPFELMVPMVQGVRVVLIGDHRQLPPMIDDNLARRANQDLPVDLDQETLFGEVFHRLPQGCKVRLSTQYRMHGDIGSVVDQVFYRRHGEGLDSYFSGDLAEKRRSRLGMLGDKPLVWVDVAPGRHRCTERNEAEAKAIVELVRRYAAAGAGRAHVAVISPYSQQRELIQRMLNENRTVRGVAQVRTVDSVQGREYPVVILGLTRTDGRPGFLVSPNRVNVAVSRAQQQLVVVGTRSRFMTSRLVRTRAPHLVQLIELLGEPEVNP